MKISILSVSFAAILLLYSSTAYTQNPWIDSVKRVLVTQKPDTTKVMTLIRLSSAYQFSNPDSGLVYGQLALALAEKSHSDFHVFWSIVVINGSLYVQGNYTRELDYALKALPLAKKLNEPYPLGYSNGMLSDCYYNLGEYPTSLKYWREVIKIAEQNSMVDLYAVYGGFTRIFNAMHQYDSALMFGRKTYEMVKHTPLLDPKYHEGKRIRSHLFTSLGDTFEGKRSHDSAIFYYRMSIPYSQGIQSEVNKIDCYNGMADVFKSTGNLDSGVWYGKKVFAEKISKSYPPGLLRAANMLAAIYELKNNPDSSLKYLHISLQIKDSLFNREKTIAFQNLIFKENEKQKEVEAATSKLQREYRTYFFTTLFTLVLVVGGIFIRNRRIKQLQKIRNSIADDLHDDIGSTLSSISIMNELAKAKSPEALSLLTTIGESTSTIQENMSDIVWAIKPENDRFENVVQRMNQFAYEILESKNIGLDFSSEASLSVSTLTMKQRKNFYLFFKEVINNAAKHSQAEKVIVNIAQKDHHIDLNIRDNGKGFDTTQCSNGNGMSSLKKRVAELNAQFNIISLIDEGTIVQLRFKIT